MNEPTAPTPRRRWFRFRLRTLLVLVTVLAFMMGWVARERRQSHHERQFAEQLEKRGATITLGGPYDSLDRFHNGQPQDRWRWLARHVLGERILEAFIGEPGFDDLAPLVGLRNLKRLSIHSTQVSDLTPLAELQGLQWAWISSTPVSDLTPLAGLKNLEGLFLTSTQVSDLTPLAGLKNLRKLDVASTPVSDEQVESLKQALPNCRIIR